MGIAVRWREYSRQYGMAGLLRHLIARAIRPAWEQAAVDLLVMEPPAVPRAARAPLQIGPVSPEQAREAGFLAPGWDQRWRDGDVCYGAWLHGVCIHHSWLTTKPSLVGEAHGWLKPSPGEAYIYDCFTSASSRGMGVFPAVLSHIEGILFGSGVQRIWIAVEKENVSSRKAIERAGFRLAGSLQYRRIGPWPQLRIVREPGVASFRFDES